MSWLDIGALNPSLSSNGSYGFKGQPSAQPTEQTGSDTSIGKMLASGNVSENNPFRESAAASGHSDGLVARLDSMDANVLRPNHRDDQTARFLDLNA